MVPTADPFGHPLDQVDRREFARLLSTAQFDALDAMLEERVQTTRADIRHEGRVQHAFEAFLQANATIEPALEAWRRARPASDHAMAAIATYRLGRALEARGFGGAAQTENERFDDMREQAIHGLRAADETLRRAPDHFMAHLIRVRLLRYARPDSATTAHAVSSALAAYPSSYLMRATLLESMEPRWGGSVAQMQAFLDDGRPFHAANPRLAALDGSVLRVEALRADHDSAFVLAKLDEARRHGEDYELLLAYGRIYRNQSRWVDALRAYHRAAALQPQGRAMLEARGGILLVIGGLLEDAVLRARVLDAAERDLLLARELRLPGVTVSPTLRSLAVARASCQVGPPPCFSK